MSQVRTVFTGMNIDARRKFEGKKKEEQNLGDKVEKWSKSLVSKKDEGGDFKGTVTKIGLGAGLTTLGLLAITQAASADAGHDHSGGSVSVPTTPPPPTPATTPETPAAAVSTHGHTAAEHAEYLANHDKLQWVTKDVVRHDFRGIDHYTHPITQDRLHVVMRDGYEAWDNEADTLSSRYPEDVASRQVHTETTGWRHDFQERIDHVNLGTYEIPRMWGDKFVLGSHLQSFPGNFKVCWEEPITRDVKIGEVPNDLNEARGPFQEYPSDVHIELTPEGNVRHVSLPTGVESVTANNPVTNADGTVKMQEKCATISESNSMLAKSVGGFGIVIALGVFGAVAYMLMNRDKD